MNSELIFRIGLGALILVLAVVRFNFIGWAVVGLPQVGRKISVEHVDQSWYRLLLCVGWLWVAAPIVYVLAPRWLDWASSGMPLFLRWIGIGLGVLGIVFLVWVHWTLGRNWNVPGVVEERQVLVTEGPYQWLRHPMYSAFAIIALAYWLITTNWFIALMGLTYWIIVVARVDMEEAALIEKFGDAYRQYRNHTGRFLPRISNGR